MWQQRASPSLSTPATEGLFLLILLTAELGIGETTGTLANPGPQFSGHWDVTAILSSDSTHHHEMTQELTSAIAVSPGHPTSVPPLSPGMPLYF